MNTYDIYGLQKQECWVIVAFFISGSSPESSDNVIRVEVESSRLLVMEELGGALVSQAFSRVSP